MFDRVSAAMALRRAGGAAAAAFAAAASGAAASAGGSGMRGWLAAALSGAHPTPASGGVGGWPLLGLRLPKGFGPPPPPDAPPAAAPPGGPPAPVAGHASPAPGGEGAGGGVPPSAGAAGAGPATGDTHVGGAGDAGPKAHVAPGGSGWGKEAPGGGEGGRKSGGGDGGGGPSRTELYGAWGLGIVGALLLASWLHGSGGGERISWQEFRNKLLATGRVERLEVQGKDTVRVYVKGNPAPAAHFEIGSVSHFERQLEDAQLDMHIAPRNFLPVTCVAARARRARYSCRARHRSPIVRMHSPVWGGQSPPVRAWSQVLERPDAWGDDHERVPAHHLGRVHVHGVQADGQRRGHLQGQCGVRLRAILAKEAHLLACVAGFKIGKARTLGKEATQKVTFADVAGCDEAKAEIVEFVQVCVAPCVCVCVLCVLVLRRDRSIACCLWTTNICKGTFVFVFAQWNACRASRAAVLCGRTRACVCVCVCVCVVCSS